MPAMLRRRPPQNLSKISSAKSGGTRSPSRTCGKPPTRQIWREAPDASGWERRFHPKAPIASIWLEARGILPAAHLADKGVVRLTGGLVDVLGLDGSHALAGGATDGLDGRQQVVAVDHD